MFFSGELFIGVQGEGISIFRLIIHGFSPHKYRRHFCSSRMQNVWHPRQLIDQDAPFSGLLHKSPDERGSRTGCTVTFCPDEASEIVVIFQAAIPEQRGSTYNQSPSGQSPYRLIARNVPWFLSRRNLSLYSGLWQHPA